MQIFSPNFEIRNIQIGLNFKPIIIAEVAQAHDGSLGFAHSFIDIASESGADAIKFQTHIADAESTLDEPFRVKFSKQDSSRYAYWKRMEFSFNEWLGLYKHALEKNLIFLSSPFSFEAIDLLTKLDIPAWKIASGEVMNYPFLDKISETKKPILISSGMSSYAEIDNVMGYLKKLEIKDVGLFQCTTKYPTPLNEIGLNVMKNFNFKYKCPVGLSDHSGDIIPAIMSMVYGASMIEVHIALNSMQFGPDTKSSLNPNQLKELCRARDIIYTIKNNDVDKDIMSRNLESVSNLFGRSIALKSPQKKGTVLTKDMLTLKKPSGGIPPNEIDKLVGKKLNKDVSHCYLLRTTDLANN